MKKLFAILLCIAMMVSMVACGENSGNENTGENETLRAGDTSSAGETLSTPSGEPTAEEMEAIDQYRQIIRAIQQYESTGEITPYVFEDFGYQKAEPAVGSKALLRYYSTLLGLEEIDRWIGTEYANDANMLWDREAAMEIILADYQNYQDELLWNNKKDPGLSNEYTTGGFKRAGTVQGDKDTICLNDYLFIYDPAGDYEEGRAYGIKLDIASMVEDYKDRLVTQIPDVEFLRDFTTPVAAALSLTKWGLPCKPASTSHEYKAELDYISIYGKFRNEEVVSFTWEAVEPELKTLQLLWDVDFVYEDFTYTFGGMLPLYEIDMELEGPGIINVSFEGTNGAGTAKAIIDIDTDYYSFYHELEIAGDNNGKLSNGDKIVVKINEAVEFDFWNSCHAKFTATELEVEVFGLAE